MKNLRSLFLSGGRGSGNFGHKGRPGQVGGSQKNNDMFESIDPISHKPTGQFTGDEKKIITDIVDNLKTFYDIGDVKIISGNTGRGEFGHHGKIAGQHYIWIDLEKIKTALHEKKFDIAEWIGISDNSYDSVLANIVAHEFGHAWWDEHSIKSKTLQKLPSGNYGIVEMNPILLNWRDNMWRKYRSSFSGYSRYFGSYKEAFCDEFAKYASGDTMNTDVEQWFVENVK